MFLCSGCAIAQSSSDEEEQAQCDQCDNEGPAGEFTECDGCGDIVCDDCRECGEDCFVCRDAASGADSTTRLPPWLTNTETETETTESDGTATPDPPTDTALLSMFCATAGIAIVPAAENAAVPAENATAVAAENTAAAATATPAAENAAVPAIENIIPGSCIANGDVVRIFRRWLNLDDEVSDAEFCGEVIQALFCPFVASLMGFDEFQLNGEHVDAAILLHGRDFIIETPQAQPLWQRRGIRSNPEKST